MIVLNHRDPPVLEQESKKNSLKDFVHISGPLSISHFLILSSTEKSPYLRVAKTPRGPTLLFRVLDYTLAHDLASIQTHRRVPATAFRHAPLVVLNNMSGSDHLKLVTVLFQNMFPPIDVQTVKLATCQRVVVLNYSAEEGVFSLRHYSISVSPVGISKPIKRLVQRKAIPNLGAFEDVGDYVARCVFWGACLVGKGKEGRVHRVVSGVA
eukprot:jgi/Mesvir1/29253/Mv19741-RA.1